MRILLTPIGSAGDTLPFVGIGQELARRGHEVSIATTDHFAGTVRRAGLTPISTATKEEYDLATDAPELFHPLKGYAAVMERVAEYDRRLYDIVMEYRRQGACTVVAHSLDFASRVVRDAAPDDADLRVVRVHLQPTILRTTYDMPVSSGTLDFSFLPRWTKRMMWAVLDRAMLDPPIAPTVNALRARAGLEPVRRILATQMESPPLTLAMFPEWFAPPQPDWPASLRQCSFPLSDTAGAAAVPGDVERFLAAGTRPVVFTPGTAMRHGQRFFDAAIGACERLGRRALLLTRHPEQLPAVLPDGVLRSGFARLSAILPRCCAIVHHGGIGTTAAALAAGVPQVIVPFSHDQPDNAARVLRLGAGRRILPGRLDARRLPAAVAELLASEATGRHCREVAALCAGRDGIAEACDLIEAFRRGPATAGSGRSRGVASGITS